MTAGGIPPGLRIGIAAGRVPGVPELPGQVHRIVVATDRSRPLPGRLAALVTLLDRPGHRWVAAASGDRDAVDYLAELRGQAGRRAGHRLITELDPGDPFLEVLLGGERALGHSVSLLQTEADRSRPLADDLVAGAAPLEQVGASGIRLALRHRPGQPWALLAWPAGRGSPLAEAGLADSDAPLRVPGGGAALITGRRAVPLVLAGLLAAGALAVTVHRGGSPAPPPQSGSAPRPTPQPTPPPPPTFSTDVAGDSPPPRQLAATAYDQGSGLGLLFGGIAQGPGAGDLADTWSWTGRAWVHRVPAHSPPGRSAAAMAYDPGRRGVVLFGGVAHGRAGMRMEDTWVWDGADWNRLEPRSGPPPGAVTVGMAWVPVRSTLLLVTDPGVPGRPPQTWTWDGAGWALAATAVTPPMRLVATDPVSGGVIGVSAGDVPGAATTWRWDGSAWSLATAAGLEFEPFTATMVSDPVHAEVVVTEQLFADAAGPTGGTWTWDGHAWIHHGGEVPDILRTFDATQALWAVAAGHVDLVGGPLDGPTYRTAWEWDGAAWHRL